MLPHLLSYLIIHIHLLHSFSLMGLGKAFSKLTGWSHAQQKPQMRLPGTTSIKNIISRDIKTSIKQRLTWSVLIDRLQKTLSALLILHSCLRPLFGNLWMHSLDFSCNNQIMRIQRGKRLGRNSRELVQTASPAFLFPACRVLFFLLLLQSFLLCAAWLLPSSPGKQARNKTW